MAEIDDVPMRFIPGLENIKDAHSVLTAEQSEEHERLYEEYQREYEEQRLKEQANKDVIRLRNQFVHVHGTLGSEKSVDTVIAMKAKEMAEHGMTIFVVNVNFLKRLQTRALYTFLKEYLVGPEDTIKYPMVNLKIQEEDADEFDRALMMDELSDVSEDNPLFVITDETCKEAERIDDAVIDLTQPQCRFHFWSSSSFAHGTPDTSRRHRLITHYTIPRTIKQVMDMIDIDDDDVDITGTHHIPLRRVVFPFDLNKETPERIRNHMEEVPVRLISHNRLHWDRDVWDCEPCGRLLGQYLADEIGIGEAGCANSEVFIVGSINRFESSVPISGLQVALMEKGIVSEALFCRCAVRIQDILKTMNKVVVSDSVSMRGVDKKIVVIIPSPREPEQQKQVEEHLKEREEREKKEKEEREKMERLGAQAQLDKESFSKPIPINRQDEELWYRRSRQPGDEHDRADQYIQPEPEKEEEGEGDDDDEYADDIEDDDSDDAAMDSDDYDLRSIPPPRKYDGRKAWQRYSSASHQSLLRRAINSLTRFDKDMILDLFTDAPRHAVMFHFAEDDYQIEIPEPDFF